MHVALADVANEAKKLGQSNNVQSPSKRFDKKCSRKKKWIEIFCFGPAEKRGGGGGVGQGLFFLGALVSDPFFFPLYHVCLCPSTS